MKKSIAIFSSFALWSVLSAAQPANPLLDINLNLMFSAVEVMSFPDSNAHSFRLECGYGVCSVTRIFFSMCNDAEDKKGEVMYVTSDVYSTAIKTLEIESNAKQSVSLRFAGHDMPYKKAFRISLSYDTDKYGMQNVTSFSGVVTQSSLGGNKKEKVIELRKARMNEERLKRTCPIGLQHF
jgi:hypothetical protein